MNAISAYKYHQVIDEICDLGWANLSREELVMAAWGYYYFSVQFRESLMIACALFPQDELLARLREGECDTDNLSPFPNIAEAGEKMNHDEYMRRVLVLSGLDRANTDRIEQVGQAYLAKTRVLDERARAVGIATYEDGGLERVFRAMLSAPDWQTPALQAFRHFLVEHIRFDSDDEAGHGALSRHLPADDSTLPLWTAFRDLMTSVTPALAIERVLAYA